MRSSALAALALLAVVAGCSQTESDGGKQEIGVAKSSLARDTSPSLSDAERETRINRRYLEALENEDDSKMPAAVYTRGFIRTYAQYLGPPHPA